MARSSPWSVKGVDHDARQVAREAAKRHGITIGEWVDRAIKTRADNSKRVTPVEALSTINTAQASSATASVPAIGEAPAPKLQIDGASDSTAGISFDVEQALKSARGKAKEFSPKNVVDSNAGEAPQKAETTTVIAASTTSKFSQYSRFGVFGSAIVAALVGGLWIYDNNLSPTSSSSQQQAAAKSKPANPATESAVIASKPKTAAPVVTELAKTTPDKQPETNLAAVTQRPLPIGNQSKDLKSLTDLANTGDHKAQFELANRYFSGKGVAKSPKQAMTWLTKAASGDIAPAQYNLGLLYETGNGVQKNPTTALAWYRKAADQGHARAQHNLGTLYAQGKGTPRNYKYAAHWFKKGTENGLADSMFSLGLMHEHGLGVTKNAETATAYYSKALSAGSAEAAKKLKQTKFAANKSATQAEITTAVSTAPAAGNPNVSGLSKGAVSEMQQLLARLDLAPGTPDGILGQKTVNAIKMYQRFAGLKVDGKATPSLLNDLRQVVGAMAPVKISAPAPSDR